MSFFSQNQSTPFGQQRTQSFFGGGTNTTSTAATSSSTVNAANPMNGIILPEAPDDTVQTLKFNPASSNIILLAAGSWDNTVRIWQVSENGTAEPKLKQDVGAPVLSIDWIGDGTKLFIASADKQARVWDLASNQTAVVGTHDQPIRTCHWIQSSSYQCLMTGSWDRTLRFWDMRQLPTQTALATIQLKEKVYCADVVYPMACVGLSNRKVKVFKLEGEPKEVADVETALKHQMRCIGIFRNKTTGQPCGFGQGSIEGRVAVQYVDNTSPKENFTFKCHRSPDIINGFQEIYPVNDVCFHPQHNTLVTAGGDGRYSYWDKDQRMKLKTSEQHPYAITAVHIHGNGNVMAYAIGYDWSRGHAQNQPGTGAKIYLVPCSDDLKPRKK